MFAGESSESCRRRGNRPKSLRQKNRRRTDTLESRGISPRRRCKRSRQSSGCASLSGFRQRGTKRPRKRPVACCSGEVMTDKSASGQLKSLPLEDLHKAAGARFGGFAGWSMPLTYPAGVMKEHLHTREHAGLFDISHMKLFELAGPGAAALLDRACPLDPAAIELTQSKYTFFLNEQAGIIDDLIVTRLAADRFMVVANAGNAAADEAHLQSLARDFDVTVDAARPRLPGAAGTGRRVGAARHRHRDRRADLHARHRARHDWFMSRSGYTGEDGFEIAPARCRCAGAGRRSCWPTSASCGSALPRATACGSRPGSACTARTSPPTSTRSRPALMWAIPKDVRATGALHRRRGAAQRSSPTARAKSASASSPTAASRCAPARRCSTATAMPPAASPPAASARRPAHPVAMGYVPAALAKPGTALLRRRARHENSRSTFAPFPSHRIATAKDRALWQRPISPKTMNGSASRATSRPSASPTTRRNSSATSSSSNCRRPAATVKKGDVAVVVESVKAASDVYAPVDGEIVEVNAALSADPALVNSAADRRRLAVEDEARRRRPARRPDGRGRLQSPHRLNLRTTQMTASTYSFRHRHIGPSRCRYARHARRHRRAIGRNADQPGGAEVDPARPAARRCPTPATEAEALAELAAKMDAQHRAEELHRRGLSRHASCRRSSSATCSRTRPGTRPTRPTRPRSARAGWRCCSTSRRWSPN